MLISWKRPSTRQTMVGSGGGAACSACWPQAQLDVRPALTVTRYQIGQETCMFRTRIQCRYVLELLAACSHEDIAVFHLAFLESLETIDCKAGTYYSDASGFAPRHFFEHGTRVWLEPRIPAEAGLEAHAPLIVLQEQLVREQARGFLTLAEIRIAVVEVAFRDTVERHQQMLGAPVFLPVLDHGGPQGVDVAGIVVILSDIPQLRQPAPTTQLSVYLIVGSPRRCAAILRKQRHN